MSYTVFQLFKPFVLLLLISNYRIEKFVYGCGLFIRLIIFLTHCLGAKMGVGARKNFAALIEAKQRYKTEFFSEISVLN